MVCSASKCVYDRDARHAAQSACTLPPTPPPPRAACECCSWNQPAFCVRDWPDISRSPAVHGVQLDDIHLRAALPDLLPAARFSNHTQEMASWTERMTCRATGHKMGRGRRVKQSDDCNRGLPHCLQGACCSAGWAEQLLHSLPGAPPAALQVFGTNHRALHIVRCSVPTILYIESVYSGC